MRPLKKLTPETALKKACLQYLSYKYGRRFWYCNIIGGLGIRPGTPDTLASLDGKFIGIEFKNGDRGRLTDYQRKTLQDINQSGGVALVIRSLDECIAQFKSLASGKERGIILDGMD